MRGRRFRRSALIVAVLVLALVACRSASDPETGVGVDAEKRIIKLGELSPLSGPVAVIGTPLTKGHEVYFKYVNEELGGVGKDLADEDKYQIELVTKDTQYVPDTHVQQYNAIKDEVLMIAQSLGTPTTKAILPQIREDGILTAPATLSSEWLKEKYLVPAGAPYPVQFINGAKWVVDQGGDPKIGIIYQDDDYGLEGLKGLEYAADKLGFEIVGKATFKSTDTDFTAQATQLKASGATVVFLTSTPSATGGIVGTAAKLGYTPMWIGQSPSWIGALADSEALLPVLEATFHVVTDGACQWGDTSAGCEGMQEMVTNLERYAPEQKPDYYFTFGYTQARIVHQILEKAIAEGDLTREGVVKAFESLKDVDMGGLLNPISYGPDCEDKIPSTSTGIFKVDKSQPIALRLETTVDADIVKEFPFCE